MFFTSLKRIWLLLFLSLSLCVAGCNSDKNGDSQTSEDEKSSARAELVRKRRCSEDFESVYQILRPTKKTMNTELRSALSLLNQWFESCADFSGQKFSQDDPTLQGILSAGQLDHLNESTAGMLDILYLRDQLLMRAMMEQIVKGAPTDVEKVRRIFAYTQRNITRDPLLIDPRLYHYLQTNFPQSVPQKELSKVSIPRTLLDIMLAGRGTDEDLSWAFVSLIQQLNIDAIMVSPVQSEQAATNTLPPLILVPIGKEILVFCSAAGLEFTSSVSADKPSWSLDDLAKDFGQLFNSISSEVSGEQTILELFQKTDWKQAVVTLPYSPLRVSPRSEALQMELAGNMTCEVFNHLRTQNDEPGLIERTSGLTDKIFSNGEIRLWEYPYEMYENVANASKGATRLRELYLATVNKTVQSIRTSVDQKENRTIKKSQVKRMQLSRVEQLLGNETEAISSYMRLQLQRGVPGGNASLEIQKENLLRALQSEDARYWSALCQFEKNDFRAAGNTTINYLKRYPEGRWQHSALELLAESQARQNEFSSAIDVFSQVKFPAPRRARQLLKLKRWEQQAAKINSTK